MYRIFKALTGGILIILLTVLALCVSVHAEQPQSRLFDVTKSGTLRVCTYPGYPAISYRNPQTQQLEGVDIDLAHALADSLGAKLQFVETSFAAFIADLQVGRCEVAMFGIGVTLKRAQAVEFSKPYLQTGVYAVARRDGRVRQWGDIDAERITIAVSLGSYIEPWAQSQFHHARVVSIGPPATREQELMGRHADVALVDYPNAQRVAREFEWALIIEPPRPLLTTPFAYAVPPGDQVWLNYLNVFVDTIKRDGALKLIAERNNLGPMVLP